MTATNSRRRSVTSTSPPNCTVPAAVTAIQATCSDAVSRLSSWQQLAAQQPCDVNYISSLRGRAQAIINAVSICFRFMCLPTVVVSDLCENVCLFPMRYKQLFSMSVLKVVADLCVTGFLIYFWRQRCVHTHTHMNTCAQTATHTHTYIHTHGKVRNLQL